MNFYISKKMIFICKKLKNNRSCFPLFLPDNFYGLVSILCVCVFLAEILCQDMLWRFIELYWSNTFCYENLNFCCSTFCRYCWTVFVVLKFSLIAIESMLYSYLRLYSKIFWYLGAVFILNLFWQMRKKWNASLSLVPSLVVLLFLQTINFFKSNSF